MTFEDIFFTISCKYLKCVDCAEKSECGGINTCYYNKETFIQSAMLKVSKRFQCMLEESKPQYWASTITGFVTESKYHFLS
jgi:hypothetical protein